MCYHFTTPLRRRPAHVIASAQARRLAAFAGSSFASATRFAGLASEERGVVARLTFSLPHRRESSRGKTDGIGICPNPVVCGVGKGTRTLDTRNHNPVL